MVEVSLNPKYTHPTSYSVSSLCPLRRVIFEGQPIWQKEETDISLLPLILNSYCSCFLWTLQLYISIYFIDSIIVSQNCSHEYFNRLPTNMAMSLSK